MQTGTASVMNSLSDSDRLIVELRNHECNHSRSSYAEPLAITIVWMFLLFIVVVVGIACMKIIWLLIKKIF